MRIDTSTVSVSSLLVLLLVGLALPALAKASYPGYTGRWAHADHRSPILAEPEIGAKRVGKLHLLTEDEMPEIYSVRSLWTGPLGQDWVKIGIPGRPNGQRGWVRAEQLGTIRNATQLLRINRRHLTARLWQFSPSGESHLIWQARVGIGAPGTPTPRGDFWIRQKLRNVGGSEIYGPLAFGTAAYSSLSEWPSGGVIGIHGTNEPELLPGRVSHGCIRVKNEKIRKLGRRLQLGTPLEIR